MKIILKIREEHCGMSPWKSQRQKTFHFDDFEEADKGLTKYVCDLARDPESVLHSWLEQDESRQGGWDDEDILNCFDAPRGDGLRYHYADNFWRVAETYTFETKPIIKY